MGKNRGITPSKGEIPAIFSWAEEIKFISKNDKPWFHFVRILIG
jgi:hypothetical protein